MTNAGGPFEPSWVIPADKKKVASDRTVRERERRREICVLSVCVYPGPHGTWKHVRFNARS
jgi:hypothetical protein